MYDIFNYAAVTQRYLIVTVFNCFLYDILKTILGAILSLGNKESLKVSLIA